MGEGGWGVCMECGGGRGLINSWKPFVLQVFLLGQHDYEVQMQVICDFEFPRWKSSTGVRIGG